MAPIPPGEKLNAKNPYGHLKYSLTSNFLNWLGKKCSPLKNDSFDTSFEE
ncbi:hypothetical protein ACQKE5_06570 [Paenisporosarcina sp. NPDC076898]